MKNLLASDKHPMSRRRIIRHAFASGSLLVTGILVVGFAQMGGEPVSSTTYPSYGCSQSTTRTALTPAAYHGYYTTYTTTQPRTVTKTIYRTRTTTRTIYRTRTKTVCQTVTVTGSNTTTETVTETVTEKGPTTTVTVTPVTSSTAP